MSRKNNKKLLVMVLLAVFLAVCFYEYKNRKKPADEAINEILKESQVNIDAENVGAENFQPLQIENPRQKEAMDYVSDNIEKISTVAPVLGGKWHVNRFWAVDSLNSSEKIEIYAECEDGHIMRKFLVGTDFSKTPAVYEVEAVFEPGEADWNLVQGKDLAFGKPLILFEKNQEKNEWERK